MSECTSWQRKCRCDECEKQRRSLRALQASYELGFIDYIVYSQRLYQEEIKELRGALSELLMEIRKMENSL